MQQNSKKKIMTTRKLSNLEVSAIGMGCMGFSTAYGKVPEESESIRLMRSDARIVENLGAADVELSDAEYTSLTTALNQLKVYGERTDEQIAELGKLRTELYGSSGVHHTK